jgi:aspartyl-tRNA(Asn)/glutamyl-tRNA(Gln) amidotransferase subunit A
MTQLIQLDFAAVRQGLRSKAFTVRELVSAYLGRMDETRTLNMYITETADIALAAAKTADAYLEAHEPRPLEGLPLAVKDIFCTKGVRTTNGSKMLANFYPTYESTITQRLYGAGAIMLGKTNMDEFAMGSSTITSAYGPSINPWKMTNDDADLVPGGSSGGSTAAVAAGAALMALATDTGGSIRQPAAFCGIVGIKPTYGLCSRYGVIAFASSLDQAGPVARTVRDTAILLQHMAGHDPMDSTSLNRPAPNYEGALTGHIKGLKVGIPKEYRPKGLNAEVDSWWHKTTQWLKDEGAEIQEISLPHTEHALAVYYIVAPAEAASNLARYDGVRFGHRATDIKSYDDLVELSRTEGFGEEVKRRIMIGTYVLSAGAYDEYFLHAQKVRRLVANDFTNAFQKVDVILTPTTAGPAFKLGENITDPLSMYLQDVFTVATNLAGLPAISLPVGLSSEGLPLGMQLIGPAFQEERLFNVASVIEKHAAFTQFVTRDSK